MWDQSCHQVWDYPVNGGKSVMLQHKVGGVAEARDGAQRSRIPMYNVAKKVRIIPVVRSPPPPPAAQPISLLLSFQQATPAKAILKKGHIKETILQVKIAKDLTQFSNHSSSV